MNNKQLIVAWTMAIVISLTLLSTGHVSGRRKGQSSWPGAAQRITISIVLLGGMALYTLGREKR